MDAFFAGGPGDGLTKETPYVLEDIYIQVKEGEDGVSFHDTSRHVVIRRVQVRSDDLARGNVSILLHGSSNITIEDCTLEGTGKGIVAEFTRNLTIVRVRRWDRHAVDLVLGCTLDREIEDEEAVALGIGLPEHGESVPEARLRLLEKDEESDFEPEPSDAPRRA